MTSVSPRPPIWAFLSARRHQRSGAVVFACSRAQPSEACWVSACIVIAFASDQKGKNVSQLHSLVLLLSTQWHICLSNVCFQSPFRDRRLLWQRLQSFCQSLCSYWLFASASEADSRPMVKDDVSAYVNIGERWCINSDFNLKACLSCVCVCHSVCACHWFPFFLSSHQCIVHCLFTQHKTFRVVCSFVTDAM